MTTSSAPTASPQQRPPSPPFPPSSEPVRTEQGGASELERRCLNCGAALATPFCAQCGQRDIEPTFAVRDFMHELVAEHFGLDSKVARTLVALVRWPGRLTREFIQGRRVRYVPPLRLYLSLSVLFFLLSALTNRGTTKNSEGVTEVGGGVARIDTTGARATRTADSVHVTSGASPKQRRVPWTSKDDFLKDTLHSGVIARWIKRRLNQRLAEFRADKKTAGTQLATEFQHELPDAVFLLVPMLALMLSVLYFGQRRYYAEHLVFALHFQAFVFAALIAAMLPIPFIEIAIWLAGIAYAYVALRTVYAEGRGMTALKLGALGLGYAICASLVMALLGLGVFFFG